MPWRRQPGKGADDLAPRLLGLPDRARNAAPQQQRDPLAAGAAETRHVPPLHARLRLERQQGLRY
ncbi:MAG TPA: hypothetical protein VLM41_02280 [Steroidobacteraceae bacterium]|nr:hypothetical protein [Steroidobacteraceae bacterium]